MTDFTGATVREGDASFILIDGQKWFLWLFLIEHPDWDEPTRVAAQRDFDALILASTLRGYTDRLCVERGPGELVPVPGPVRCYSWAPLPPLTPHEWRQIEARMNTPGAFCPPRLLDLLADRLAENPLVVA